MRTGRSILRCYVLVLAACTAMAGGPELRAVDAGALLKTIEGSRARVVAVNLWATWCIPCREEFPELLQFRTEKQPDGFELLLVSTDLDPENDGTVAFLESMGVDFPSYLKEGDDQVFLDRLSPDWSGMLPTTIWFVDGELRRTHEGKLDTKKLDKIWNELTKGI